MCIIAGRVVKIRRRFHRMNDMGVCMVVGRVVKCAGRGGIAVCTLLRGMSLRFV